MTAVTVVPAPTLAAGDERHGFRIDGVTALPAVAATAYRATHLATGAEFLHLHAEDPENLFAIALRTPPSDDSGIAHILEHTVLCGSRRYPVKDPFVELLKSSLASFLNAMTYPDRTVYPCASLNRRDFFNLAEIYCDAVYHPLLREDHFRQEGHRLGFLPTGDASGELVIKGIVYNEMKGSYSDFQGVWFRATKTGICPDNTYGCDSGGTPEAIPSLTYEAFCEFHRTLYHPSNSLIFCYGDIATDEHLAFLGERLADFERIEVDTEVAEQPRWQQPVRRQVPYPVGVDETLSAKHAVTMTWLCGPITDTGHWLAMDILSSYLLDHDASPLRRALIASGLGQGMAPSGYFDQMRDTVFTVGLRGTEAERAEAVEAVIRDCLAAEAEGVDREALAAAFHQHELDAASVPSMYPLRLMGRAYQRWSYGADPIESLDLSPRLAELRERFEREPGFFEGLIREQLVDNPHCLIQTFVPDPHHNRRNADRERSRIEAIGGGLSDEERSQIASEDTRMEQAQAAPNRPEDLASLPRLALDDVPGEGIEPAVQRHQVGDAVLLRSDVLSAGVSHCSAAFDLSGLDDDLIEYLPLFATALARLGAGEEGWEALARRQELVMRGVNVGSHVGARADDPLRAAFHLDVSTAALHRNMADALAIVSQRINGLRLDEHDRLMELIRERRSGLRNGVIPGGSGYATAYASRGLGRAAAIGERKGGFSQIRFFEPLADDIQAHFDRVLDALARIRDHVAQRAPLVVSFVGDDRAAEAVAELAEPFRDRGAFAAIDQAMAPAPARREGVATAADVAYVARVAPLGPQDDASAAAFSLLATQLRAGFLWERIRVQGGAYGARTGYQRQAGTFSVASYRDPHIAATLETYAAIADHVRDDLDLSPAGLEQAVIGTVKTIDTPLRPGQAVGTTLGRHLRGSTPERRQAFREALLALDADTVRAAGERLGAALAEGPVCVLSSREKLEAANRDAGLGLEIGEL